MLRVAPRWAWLQKRVTSRSLGNFAAALILLGIIGLELSAQSILQKMADLRSRHYDNSVWTVSQLEVEFQRFLLSLHEAIAAVPPATRTEAIAEVVRSFDIYFSRVAVVSTRAKALAPDPTVAVSTIARMAMVESHLRMLEPLIDGSIGKDAAYLRRVLALATPISPVLRRNTMTSLQYIIERDSDQYAERIGLLRWFLWLSQAMVVLLCGIAFLIYQLFRKLNQRSLDLARVSSNLDKAIQTSLDAMVITDTSGRVIAFNPAAEAMFGKTFAEANDNLIEDLLYVRRSADGGGGTNGRHLAATLARAANQGRVRLNLHRGDGTDFMVEVAIASDVDSDGKPIFMGFLRDISKLVEAEENEQAARLAAERSAAANARFLAVMSHEMRTPLHGIIASLELLEIANSAGEDVTLRKIARDCAGTALEQIEEVLELAQHEADDLSGVILTFFPVEVARIIVDQSQSLAAANSTALTLTFEASLSGPVHGNRRAFRSALANLVGNAIKFTHRGRITVRLYPTPGVSGTMRVEVEDSGIGIEPEHQMRIFDDFETVPTSSPQVSVPSGLGLGIVRRAVRQMGGTLGMVSTFGRGTRIWFDVPRISTNPVQLAKEGKAEPVPSGRPLSVLVVDDNAINRLLMAQMLERLGHRVDLADDGAVAVQAAFGRRYDLILMDINMPGMGGLEATREIRAAGASSKTAIMGVTANAQPKDFARHISAGMNCTVIKPITFAGLARQVHDLVNPPEQSAPSQGAPVLIAFDTFLDLRLALPSADFLAIAQATFKDARLALGSVHRTQSDESVATHLHHAAGSAAVIGANRLRLILCDLENAVRAGRRHAIGGLTDQAEAALHETEDWFQTANRPPSAVRP